MDSRRRIVGAIGTSPLGAVKQQTVSHAPDSSRLVVSLHSATVGQAAFVKDTKSEGCWIVITKNDGLAIAPAPIRLPESGTSGVPGPVSLVGNESEPS